MTLRLRFVLAGLALAAAVYLGLAMWQTHRRAALSGLTDAPCTAAGRSVTGNDYDDWGALCFYRAQNARLRASGQRPEVVMIGDSITMGWPGQGAAVVNRGIGKQSSSQILLRFIQDAAALKPRVVHILAGTNDVAGTTGPVTPGQLEDNLRAMITLAQARGLPVVLGTVPPAAGSRAGIARVNTVIRRIARNSHAVVLADYHAVLANPDGTPKAGLLADGTHPSPAGYAAMQPVFARAVRSAKAIAGKPVTSPPDALPPDSGKPPSSR
ncbi:GDSL-type esterase/lipase family protein [Novosphingobium beihaiensis]|uniref:GDSL-type esterase/lipase family protein n=1 Tax=Novosphingobium beihaiensis TaxID=2930389 RepID=A0ABT0BVS2_9SPHN|nr:GDSL-type esterase/lipase family protein [Novosphingobium beihaiensis]MCJ2188911.1 GDSL-type esterase/lipase family protein [Novosphingobium beihaiensis]